MKTTDEQYKILLTTQREEYSQLVKKLDSEQQNFNFEDDAEFQLGLQQQAEYFKKIADEDQAHFEKILKEDEEYYSNIEQLYQQLDHGMNLNEEDNGEDERDDNDKSEEEDRKNQKSENHNFEENKEQEKSGVNRNEEKEDNIHLPDEEKAKNYFIQKLEISKLKGQFSSEDITRQCDGWTFNLSNMYQELSSCIGLMLLVKFPKTYPSRESPKFTFLHQDEEGRERYNAKALDNIADFLEQLFEPGTTVLQSVLDCLRLNLRLKRN
ncbi:hypothetical protein K502DRAFT_343300 [Neoconidiobolus thromboides FSU 785]|nr:hypothetical protein K502DRAFT_343300 [Neoconidiobolus thromboides FSU 785]